MKYKTIEKIYPKLDTIKNVSFKIQIALLRNKSLLSASFELIQEIKKRIVSEEYMSFHTELTALYEKFCVRLPNGNYSPNENSKEEFENLYKELHNKFSKTLEEFEENEKLYKEFLQVNIEVSLIKYSLDELPDDLSCLNKDEIDVLFEFINN